jgi:trehalose 2-sulfotransferase
LSEYGKPHFFNRSTNTQELIIPMAKFPPSPPIFPDAHKEQIEAYFSPLLNDTPPAVELPTLHASYFICFTNRCGSNLVAQALASDGQLSQAGENLNFTTVINHSKRLGHKSYDEYFRWLMGATKGKRNVFGCKSSVSQLMYLYNCGLLQRMNPLPDFIHVVRRDLIAQAVSLYIANQTNQWTSEQPKVEGVEIEYRPNQLIHILRSIALQNSLFEGFFQLIGVAPHVVVYEDFVAAPAEAISAIGKKLRLPGLELVQKKISYSKQADERNQKLVDRLIKDFSLQPITSKIASPRN